MLSLAVTSSTAAVGVAVGPAGATPDRITARHLTTDRRHAEELTPLIQEALSEAGVTMGDVEQFVVDVGPGRFTGLRVGLATVRTLALATNKPVVAMTSLEILAGGEPQRPVLVVVDARRAEVFQQRFGPSGPETEAIVGRAEELAPDPAEEPALIIVGDGADRYPEHYGPGVRPGREPSAATMLALSVGRRSQPGREVEPVYLRDPDVNVNVKTRHTPR